MNLISKASNWLSGFTIKFWLIVCAVLIACLPVAYCKGVSDGKAIEREAQTAADNKALRDAREADQEAARRRAEGERQNTENSNARKEAIDNAPDDQTDAPGRALACERLRQAGKATPAACG